MSFKLFIKVKFSRKFPNLHSTFSYMKQAGKLQITEKRVAKVVPTRSFSVAFHPTTDKVLVATGDKWGRLGLWDVVSFIFILGLLTIDK